jgi:hypothetical protein
MKRIFRPTLLVIAIVQTALGAVFLIPGGFATALSLPDAPAWTDWIFVMLAARCLGFGFGMFVAWRNPAGNQSWVTAMIGVQAIDWIGTISYLALGTVTLATVTTAAFLPLLFIAVLVVNLPNRPEI